MRMLLVLFTLVPALMAQIPEIELPQADVRILEEDRTHLPGEWHSFARSAGWSVYDWDLHHSFPHRAGGRGWELPGGLVDSAADLDQRLRRFLAEHPLLLHGGKSAGLENIALDHAGLHGDVWYANYSQRWRGKRVAQSELTFRVTPQGRLLLAGSDLHPEIEASEPALDRTAIASICNTLGGDMAVESVEIDDEWILLPLLQQKGFRFRSAWPAMVNLEDPEHNYRVFLDGETGEILWSWNLVRHLSGTLHGIVEEQQPSDPDEPQPFPHVFLNLDGEELTSDADGLWDIDDVTGDGPWTLSGMLHGRYARVQRQDGANAFFLINVESDGETQLISTDDALIEELDAYLHTTRVHDFIKSMDESFTGLDEPLTVRVNIDDTCNAYWDGNSINFFHEGGGCPNTGRVAGVVYHEYGHGINDRQYMQAGEPWGMSSGAMHEGLADVTAIYLQDEDHVAPGWNIRVLDNTNRYPEDIAGQVHNDGLIIGGAMYDLRLLLGLDLVRPMYHFARWGTPDDPNMGRACFEYFLELLVLDDDDGDLANLTPNFAAIDDAFNQHGVGSVLTSLYTEFALDEPSFIHDPMTELPLRAELLAPGFVVPEAVEVVYWTPGGDDQVLQLEQQEDGGWTGSLPGQPWNTLLLYYARVINPADVEIVTPSGAPEQVYRTRFVWDAGLVIDFEEEPVASVINELVWEWGQPASGPGMAGDGERCWATGLAGNYGDNQLGRLVLPEQEVTDEDQVIFSFLSWMSIEEGWDGGNIELSINGQDWEVLQPLGGYDFYTPDNNIVPGVPAFTGSSEGWERIDCDLTTLTSPGDLVALRFNFMSDGAVVDAGWFIDRLSLMGFLSPATILHEPLGDREDALSPLLLTASISSAQELNRFDCIYRVDGGAEELLPLVEEDGLWSATIPGSFWEQEIEYRLEAEGAGGYQAYLPQNPADWFRFRIGTDVTPPTVEWVSGPVDVPGFSAMWRLKALASDNLEAGVSLVELQWSEAGLETWSVLGEFSQEAADLYVMQADFLPGADVDQVEFRLRTVDAGTSALEAFSPVVTVSMGDQALLDDFENMLLPAWSLEGVWTAQDIRVHDGELALGTGGDGFYEPNAEGRATLLGGIDLRRTDHPALVLWETCFIELGDDEAMIEVSRDLGETWELLAHRTGVLPWTESIIPLDDYVGEAELMLRFSFQADDDDAQPRIGYFVDNLRVVNQLDTGVADPVADLPAGFQLGEVWPNPFNPVAHVELQLAAPTDLQLGVYNLAGQLVSRLHAGELPAGSHLFRMDGGGWASGLYLVRLESRLGSETRKLMLIR